MFANCSTVPGHLAQALRRLSVVCGVLVLSLSPTAAHAQDIPAYLPRYDLDIKIDVNQHLVAVSQRVQWTNPHQLPTDKLVFNVALRYTIDPAQIGLLAKMFGNPPARPQ